MKIVLIVLVLLMTSLVVNAQTNIVVIDKSDRTPVQIGDLQGPITAHIARNYVGFIINQATRVVIKNVITYEVIIVQATTADTLIYDQNYNFVQKIVQNDSIKTTQKIRQQ